MLTVKNVKGFFWSYQSYQSLYVGASKRADVIPIEPFETCYFCVFGNSWQGFKEMVTDTEMTATESRIKLQATRASLSRKNWKGSPHRFKRVAGNLSYT